MFGNDKSSMGWSSDSNSSMVVEKSPPPSEMIIGCGYPMTILQAQGVLFQLRSAPQPIAVCSYEYRYHANNGRGALKYDPVSCSKILNADACQALRSLRGVGNLSFHFSTLLLPQCENLGRKVMAVPSVGLPASLVQQEFLQNLLWVARSKQRPTVLIVHQVEAAEYLQQLGEILKKNGVGLVAWHCDEGVFGFGVSRLAAQQYAASYGKRSLVVLSDVNVANSEDVAAGYDTDNEDTFPVKGDLRYTSAGFGAGKPWYHCDENGELVPTKTTRGGAGRPIEQVITVSEEMFYDPCFITSSEDADLTQSFIHEQNLSQDLSQGEKFTSADFKYSIPLNDEDSNYREAWIEKVEIGDALSPVYFQQRNAYLERLAHENDMPIVYRKSEQQRMVERTVTVGELARQIAGEHGLNPVEIRSLIIEKIILRYKELSL